MTLALGDEPHRAAATAGLGRAGLLRALGLVSLGLAIFAMSMGALILTRGDAVTAIWPANALALAALIRSDRRRASVGAILAVALVALAAPLSLGGLDMVAALLMALANVLEIALAAFLVQRFVDSDGQVETLDKLMRFGGVCVAAPALAAAVNAPLVMSVTGGSAFSVWRDIWAADALGLLVFAPIGLALRPEAIAALPLRRRIETGLILIALMAMTVAVFLSDLTPGLLILTPPLILASLRGRELGAGAASLIVTVLGIGFTLAGQGPIAALHGLTASEKAVWMQIWLAAATLSTLPVAAVLRERDRFAAELEAQGRRLQAASDGKSRLLANVSHEIKSPVAGIIGIGELWAHGRLGAVTHEARDMAQVLVRTARQVEALAYDLLDVAQAESGKVPVDIRPVDLDGLIQDVRGLKAATPGAQGLVWRIESDGESGAALGDSVRLSQVLDNLVGNAIKYGGSGGQIRLRRVRTGDRQRVEVIDLGPGVPQNRLGELFEPFNRLGMERTMVEGHGIGLTLARRLVEIQGGAIGYEPGPGGRGACFWFDLPAA